MTCGRLQIFWASRVREATHCENSSTSQSWDQQGAQQADKAHEQDGCSVSREPSASPWGCKKNKSWRHVWLISHTSSSSTPMRRVLALSTSSTTKTTKCDFRLTTKWWDRTSNKSIRRQNTPLCHRSSWSRCFKGKEIASLQLGCLTKIIQAKGFQFEWDFVQCFIICNAIMNCLRWFKSTSMCELIVTFISHIVKADTKCSVSCWNWIFGSYCQCGRSQSIFSGPGLWTVLPEEPGTIAVGNVMRHSDLEYCNFSCCEIPRLVIEPYRDWPAKR